jgi:putative membrane protein
VSQVVLAALLVVAAQVYNTGNRRLAHRRGRWRQAAFAVALVLIALVLCTPYDRIADRSLAAHMLQHIVLMGFVPPLLLLAAPSTFFWRVLPLTARRRVAPKAMRLRRLISPWPAFLLLNIDLAVWHVPWLYDLTLRSEPVHYLEHATFLLTGTLFWVPILDSPPLRARLNELQAAGYALAGAATGWVLALVLAFAPSPLYPAYASLHHRLFGLSALADQQLAGGLMLAIGSIPLSVAIFVFLYRWLDETTRNAPRHTVASKATIAIAPNRLANNVVVMPPSKPVRAGRALGES